MGLNAEHTRAGSIQWLISLYREPRTPGEGGGGPPEKKEEKVDDVILFNSLTKQ